MNNGQLMYSSFKCMQILGVCECVGVCFKSLWNTADANWNAVMEWDVTICWSLLTWFFTASLSLSLAVDYFPQTESRHRLRILHPSGETEGRRERSTPRERARTGCTPRTQSVIHSLLVTLFLFLFFFLPPSQVLFFPPDDLLSHSKFTVFICVRRADIFHLSSLLLFLSSLIGHCWDLLRSLQENGPATVCVCSGQQRMMFNRVFIRMGSQWECVTRG